MDSFLQNIWKGSRKINGGDVEEENKWIIALLFLPFYLPHLLSLSIYLSLSLSLSLSIYIYLYISIYIYIYMYIYLYICIYIYICVCVCILKYLDSPLFIISWQPYIHLWNDDIGEQDTFVVVPVDENKTANKINTPRPIPVETLLPPL